MGKLDERVCSRVKGWVAAQMTQAEFGRRIGRNDSWVSRYFDENHDADLDTIAKMAEACGHTIFEAIDLRPSIKEENLLGAFRQVPPERRDFVIEVVRQLAGSYQQKRVRSR